MSEGAAILAVDGGNSKTELILATGEGQPLAFVRGRTISHQAVGLEPGMVRLRRLLAVATAEAGLDRARPAAGMGVFCLAGADLRSDVRRLTNALRHEQASTEVVVLNDTVAALRAGSRHRWGVAIICGSGVNSTGIGPDGRMVGLPALGNISGDWGGGRAVGEAALTAALRGRDGRGPRTALERVVPAYFGLRRPLEVTWALYHGRLAEERLRELSPLVFAAATDGDGVARGIVDRLADELATMAVAILRRLRLVRSEVDVVLAGGVMQTSDAAFFERIDRRIRDQAPRAQVRRLTEPPVVGAGLLALDRLPGAPANAEASLRSAMRERRPTLVDG